MSVASTGWPGVTRLMKDSLTSTWISSESMSTMVPMPVRVKPPPAEIGEIISPGCADLATTTPLNGARITVLSSCTWATATDSCATLTCSSVAGQPRAQHVALGERRVERLRADQLRSASSCWRA